jgi:hypothetical protein
MPKIDIVGKFLTRRIALGIPLFMCGFFLCAITLPNESSESPEKNIDTWRFLLFILGFVLMLISPFSAFLKLSSKTAYSEYEVLIVSPLNCGTLIPPFEIKGTYKGLPERFELWIFLIHDAAEQPKYWPQEAAEPKGGQWSVRINPGRWQAGEHRRYGVFLVGPNGKALVSLFKSSEKRITASGSYAGPPLIGLTDDIVECDECEVIFR